MTAYKSLQHLYVHNNLGIMHSLNFSLVLQQVLLSIALIGRGRIIFLHLFHKYFVVKHVLFLKKSLKIIFRTNIIYIVLESKILR